MRFFAGQNFEPRVFTGGSTKFYLPLFYDAVAQEKPQLVVTVGLSDGQAHFAFCQAAAQHDTRTRCVAIRRQSSNEGASEDPAWARSQELTRRFFPAVSELPVGDAVEVAAQFGNGSVDLLLLDDVDSGTQLEAELDAWRVKLKPAALVLFHGINLEREDAPRNAWAKLPMQKIEFDEGIGLGLATAPAGIADSPWRNAFFEEPLAAIERYRVSGEVLSLRVKSAYAQREAEALATRQLWLDTIFEDRARAQRIMDHQRGAIAQLTSQEEVLRADRGKAQRVMDSQFAQLQKVGALLDKTRTELANLKRTMAAAKTACGRRGRCFRPPGSRRPVFQRIARELGRMLRNIRRIFGNDARAGDTQSGGKGSETNVRYREWLAAHEPAAEELQRQRAQSADWSEMVSLLIPVFEAPRQFVDELFASLLGQTCGSWEACVIDAGSTNRETLAALRHWSAQDRRIRVERLEKNLGIAENTNRALASASGDLIALADHDDVLAPSAVYHLLEALRSYRGASVFYSDEDRLTERGERAKPFLKPEWSPELLYSCMYLGHLTAYRRKFAIALGGFRKEFELSQDYDFALRATEQANGIVHIPHVLYHWREHPGSGASGGKPEARKTNLAALRDAISRRGLDAEVCEYPQANRVRMRLKDSPRVSLIIPTDSPARLQKCARELPRQAASNEIEIIIITNSGLIDSIRFWSEAPPPMVRFVAFDEPFNFSAKCNAGAAVATGCRLIFVNDDVETDQPDWMENLIEPLENAGVGAVAPKLLYPSGNIQHAGLVTGVRDFIGTAFHQLPADTNANGNLAQSMRDVSALSGACLAMRREDFVALGGFDQVNTPISHSDVDLCFKVRARGKRCIYTPFATMRHVGHASISAAPTPSVQRDKSTIHLLKRWGEYLTRDPYFTKNMRDWLFADSPLPVQMFARNHEMPASSQLDVLFVSQDLSLSGAPLLLLHLVEWCRDNGIFSAVASPVDGPLRQRFVEADVPLIIDPLIARGHESFGRLAAQFDVVVANTIKSVGAISAARQQLVPVAWWLHETKVGEHFMKRDARVGAALMFADLIFAPSEASLAIYRPHGDGKMRRLVSGIPDLRARVNNGASPDDGRVRFLMLGTVEPRKGQDILVEAIRRMNPKLAEHALFEVVGSGLDAQFIDKIRAAASSFPNLRLREGVDYDRSIELLAETDVLVCASRDESLPLTLLEAMCLGKSIISTDVGGIPEYLTNEIEALLVPAEDAGALSAAFERVVRNREEARTLGRNARAAYERRYQVERFGRDFAALIAPLARRRKA
ncbi:MAG: glycosyltransferase [Chthoniobacterales bacterium]